jgi:hypothetical protein
MFAIGFEGIFEDIKGIRFFKGENGGRGLWRLVVGSGVTERETDRVWAK